MPQGCPANTAEKNPAGACTGILDNIGSKKRRCMMFEEPRLSDQEWMLVVELLERERSELPVEIHHTRSASVRSELHDRAEMVRELLARLRHTTTV